REVTDFDTNDWDDYLHFNDAQGTAKNEDEVKRSLTPPAIGYAVSAAGEPLGLTTGAPSETNHIQWQGAFLEDKELTTSAGSDRGNLYRMGVRHYSPAYGRFLQRDPLNNYRTPNAMAPLAHNPYQYGYNQATEYADTSGYACCGMGAPGTGEIIRNPDNTNGESNGNDCIIPWPDLSNCQASTCSHCCVDANGAAADPCGDALCLFFHTPDEWTSCECYKYCALARAGGEHAPSIVGHWSINPVTPTAPHWNNPPALGLGGNGGAPLRFIPSVPSPVSPSPITRFTPNSVYFSGLVEANIQLPLHQACFAAIKMDASEALLGVGMGLIGDIFAWLWRPFGSNVVESIANLVCNVMLMSANCKDPISRDLANCLLDACCEFKACIKHSNPWLWGATAGFALLGLLGGPLIAWNAGVAAYTCFSTLQAIICIGYLTDYWRLCYNEYALARRTQRTIIGMHNQSG
ncbi:MAG: hypothetical protein NTY09_15145, partial [bacterium]|nr:hypothetical protein [bacterium]